MACIPPPSETLQAILEAAVSRESRVEDATTSCYRLCPQLGHGDGFLGPSPVRGLSNIGKSCYLNAAMQSLLATDGVREYYLRSVETVDARLIGGSSSDAREGALTAAVRAFIVDMHTSGAAEESIRPVRLLSAVSGRNAQYGQRAEQDAHEVLRLVLDGLHEEELSKRTRDAQLAELSESSRRRRTPWAVQAAKNDEQSAADRPTLVSELFSGELRSTVVCCTCGQLSRSHTYTRTCTCAYMHTSSACLRTHVHTCTHV